MSFFPQGCPPPRSPFFFLWRTQPYGGERTPEFCLGSRIARLAAEARSHKSAYLAGTVEVPISGRVTTVAPCRTRGRSVSCSLVRIPFQVGRQREPFQRGSP